MNEIELRIETVQDFDKVLLVKSHLTAESIAKFNGLRPEDAQQFCSKYVKDDCDMDQELEEASDLYHRHLKDFANENFTSKLESLIRDQKISSTLLQCRIEELNLVYNKAFSKFKKMEEKRHQKRMGKIIEKYISHQNYLLSVLPN